MFALDSYQTGITLDVRIKINVANFIIQNRSTNPTFSVLRRVLI